MAEREPTVVEQMVSAWRASPGRHDASMLAALRVLREAVIRLPTVGALIGARCVNSVIEEHERAGMTTARHQAVVDEETECNQRGMDDEGN